MDKGYEDFREEYEEISSKVLLSAEPEGVYGFGRLPGGLGECPLEEGSEICCCIMTLGKGVSSFIDGCFKNDEYFLGMMADSIADSIYFSFEEQLLSDLEQYCRNEHKGIRRRFEAPSDIAIKIHEYAFHALKADKTLNIGITGACMFDPVKTGCIIFELCDDESVFNTGHDCGSCPKNDCEGRRKDPAGGQDPGGADGSGRVDGPGESRGFSVEIIRGDQRRVCFAEEGDNLLQLIRQHFPSFSAPCGGRGLCGKCGVRIMDALGTFERLSCRTEIRGDMAVVLPEDEGGIRTVTAGTDRVFDALRDGEGKTDPENDFAKAGCGAAIDLGTTTLCFALVDLRDGRVLNSFSKENPQRSFGADVLTRIGAAGRGHAGELREIIIKSLVSGIETLLDKVPGARGHLLRISVAGNTTMIHLLRGYDTSGLGSYPFNVVNISLEELTLGELIPEGMDPGGSILREPMSQVPLTILPGISAFIGGDIVSGSYYLGLHEREGISAFIDLGTNGEMAIGNRDRILASSAAAGPAFEGGRIKWGRGSVQGAVSKVEIREEKAFIRTIGDKTPAVGICGTGIIETVSELLENKIMDDTGLLTDRYFDEGFPLTENAEGETIRFTEDDVREVQLAKSAIRSGFEVLLKRWGIAAGDIDRLYLAGGFGHYLDVAKAARIGMIPEELRSRTIASGNTALKGAINFLKDPEAGKDGMKRLCERIETIELAEDWDFNRLYMDNMMFSAPL